ncbi:MAG: beta-ketoacyl-[acyl-carrier-protein] synthase family protein [Chitinophagaceae bacterium]
MSRIVITGLGIISAIGSNVAENRLALIKSTCGVTQLDLFSSRYAGVLPCGEIKFSTSELKERLFANDPGITRTTLLALHAFEEASKDCGLTADQLSADDTALVAASTVGGMCLTDELYQDAHMVSGGSTFLSSYDCGSVALYLRDRFNMRGIINTINTACSSSANAIMYGARLIKNGFANRCIVGGTDSLAKFTLNGFNSMHILSRDLCTPFDLNRNGLNLGEGAAFLVLEKEEDAFDKRLYASLSGYGNANDAFHPSSLSEDGEGPYLAMKAALATARLEPGQVDFINAHGTGTENNDESESKAMLRLFPQPPPFASTKSNVGHTLGAAGAVQAVYSVLNLVQQEVYPSLHYTKPIPSTGLQPVLKYAKMPLQHVMSNSFAFGGNCTSLIFSKA